MSQLLTRGNFKIGAYFLRGKRKCANVTKCQLWKIFGNSILLTSKWHLTVSGPQINENIWIFLQFHHDQNSYRTNLPMFQGRQSQASEQIFWDFFKLLFIFSKLSRIIESAYGYKLSHDVFFDFYPVTALIGHVETCSRPF